MENKKQSQMGIIPIVDLGVVVLAVFFGAADRLGPRSPALDFALEPLAFQVPPVEAPFLPRGRLVYGRLERPLESEAAGPDSMSSPGSKPGDSGGGK